MVPEMYCSGGRSFEDRIDMQAQTMLLKTTREIPTLIAKADVYRGTVVLTEVPLAFFHRLEVFSVWRCV